MKEKTVRGTREWAVATVDCTVGCLHDCRYCYARYEWSGKRENAEYGQWKKCHTDHQAVQRQYPLYEGQVMFPANHDIHRENLEACLEVLRKLLVVGNQVLVVSKPDPDCIRKICQELSCYKENLLFRFTITARDQTILGFWEPGAPSYKNRLLALQHAFEMGFKTSVSVEPMLDVLDTPALVEELQSFVSHSIWLGKMNKIKDRVIVGDNAIQEEVARIIAQQADTSIISLYEILKNNPLIRWKESIKEVVGLPLAAVAGLDR